MKQNGNTNVKDRVLNEKKCVKRGSLKEATYLDQLQTQLNNTDGDFVKYAKDIFNLSKFDGKQSDNMTKYYNQMLMMACVDPMSKGVDGDAIIQSLGMYAGMCLVNKDFRIGCNKGNGSKIGDALFPFINKQASEHGDNSIWARQRDHVLKNENNGRLPLTPKSTALQHLAFGCNAYEEMRKPGADVNSITKQYGDAISALSKQSSLDGCDPDDIATCQRTIVGQLIERDPMNAQMFNETAFDSIKRSASHEQTVADGKGGQTKQSVWMGAFEHENGEAFTSMFTPRVMMEQEEHTNRFDSFVNDDIKDCQSVGDVNAKMKDETHVTTRSLRMSMMMMDGMDLRETKNVVFGAASTGIHSWMDDHPEACKAEKDRKAQDQNQTRSNSRQQNDYQQSNATSEQTYTDAKYNVEYE